MIPFQNRSYAFLIGLLLWPVAGRSSVDHTADQILGRWLFPAKGSSVEIYRSGDRYFGRIADVSLTGQQQFGLVKNKILLSNLLFDGDSWSGGELIHPKTGNHFSIELRLRDSRTLHATVYKGIRWIHKEFVLTRPGTI